GVGRYGEAREAHAHPVASAERSTERSRCVTVMMTQIKPDRTGLHGERAPANQGGGEGESVFHPVAAGMKFSLDAAPRDRLFAWKTQRVIAQRDVQRCVEFTARLPGECRNGSLQCRDARRQRQIWRNIDA